MSAVIDTTSEKEVSTRIYEAGYHIIPTVSEEQVEKIVGQIRGLVEKVGGSFIAEGAPALTKLSYTMDAREGDKYVSHDRGYFGWLKFEAPIEAASAIDEMLKRDQMILRSIVFQTVREETRARMKAPTLREVKRSDTIRSTPRREEGAAAPVSEADLDKALQDITEE
jgi:ribosomal protein S6